MVEKMKSCIPHRLLVINEHAQENDEDPVFMTCMRLAFQWANDMGLQGKKVHSLTLQKPDPNKYDPIRQQKSLWCKIECEEDERNRWNEMQELQVKQAVYDMLKDDE